MMFCSIVDLFTSQQHRWLDAMLIGLTYLFFNTFVSANMSKTHDAGQEKNLSMAMLRSSVSSHVLISIRAALANVPSLFFLVVRGCISEVD